MPLTWPAEWRTVQRARRGGVIENGARAAGLAVAAAFQFGRLAREPRLDARSRLFEPGRLSAARVWVHSMVVRRLAFAAERVAAGGFRGRPACRGEGYRLEDDGAGTRQTAG